MDYWGGGWGGGGGAKGMLAPSQGGGKGYVGPPLKLLGGPGPPCTPSSYAYVNILNFKTVLMHLIYVYSFSYHKFYFSWYGNIINAAIQIL